jgi:SSS family solute:Na+ symporter
MSLFAASSIFVTLVFILVGIVSARGSGATDYSMAGRKSTVTGVSGILLGSLVGGASTVGTVQMAYQWGISAWWFTLGGGIGCLVLGIWFAVPLRRSGMETIPGFLSLSYGPKAGLVAVTASASGTFLSIVAQFLSGAGLLGGVVSAGPLVSFSLVAILVVSFIFLGGLRSFSSIGAGKIILLYFTLSICAAKAVLLLVSFDGTPVSMPVQPFFSLFGQGIGNGLGSGASLVTGVLCTQIYIQAVFSASSPSTARKGAILSAILMPPLGILGMIIGMSMRRMGIVTEPASALSHFIATGFHPLVGGVLWGGILITVIGTAAGLTLGVAVNIVSDILAPRFPGLCGGNSSATATRCAVLALILAAGLDGIAGQGSMILKWSYLSMGLRGSGIFFPLVASVLFPGRLSPGMAAISGGAGLLATIMWPLSGLPLEPLFAGLSVSAAVVFLGIRYGRREHPLP